MLRPVQVFVIVRAMKAVDPALFRRLLGSFATGVAVVTARDGAGRPAGMTASAIASVSLEPPLLLVCVWQDSDFHGVLAEAAQFGLSVLADDQEAVSRRFASEVGDRFDGVPWSAHGTGVPLLDGAAAHIVCRRLDGIPAGDHTIFLGEVQAGSVFDRTPLLHVRGAYRRLA
jgi:flavin reductase (DIM6/NTAB) family NADH-FMN oxidoreductase RutF